MRNFTDSSGQQWNATLLDASYGNILVLFSLEHGDDTRQKLMSAENQEEARQQLAGMDEAELRAMLAESKQWDPNSGVL
jgi:hypothetical protein